MGNDRSKEAVSRLLGNKTNRNVQPKPAPEIELTKKGISKVIKDQGSSVRTADSIRINPILMSALKYWTTIAEADKSKPDVLEDALLKAIPEEYLIEGYKLAKKQKKI
ncbi:hypothetical protein [Enterococcus casseliflavus]|uniref:hypothetical protein n=1 Tax=Enterococcus casseliflavus TaxID=37734 RepID=UPI0035E01224